MKPAWELAFHMSVAIRQLPFSPRFRQRDEVAVLGLAAGSERSVKGSLARWYSPRELSRAVVSADEEAGFAADVLLEDVEGEAAAAAFRPVALDRVSAPDRSAFRRKHGSRPPCRDRPRDRVLRVVGARYLWTRASASVWSVERAGRGIAPAASRKSRK